MDMLLTDIDVTATRWDDPEAARTNMTAILIHSAFCALTLVGIAIEMVTL